MFIGTSPPESCSRSGFARFTPSFLRGFTLAARSAILKLFKRSAHSAGPASETSDPEPQTLGEDSKLWASRVSRMVLILSCHCWAQAPESRCSVGSVGYAKKSSAYLSSDGKTECSVCVCVCVCVGVCVCVYVCVCTVQDVANTF